MIFELNEKWKKKNHDFPKKLNIFENTHESQFFRKFYYVVALSSSSWKQVGPLYLCQTDFMQKVEGNQAHKHPKWMSSWGDMPARKPKKS